MAANEGTPLLSEQAHSENNADGAPPPYQINQENIPGRQSVAVTSDELPPPYTAPAYGGIPQINCKVCQAMINLEGNQHLHVVRCSACGEATPIRAAPPGRKYIRCVCKLLLVCRAGATRIRCPRDTCKKVLNLPNSQDILVPDMLVNRFLCAYCSHQFVLGEYRSFTRCPHCGKLSSAGDNHGKKRGIFCVILGLLFIAASAGITVATYEYARAHGGIYVSWIGVFIVGVLFLVRSIFYFSVKTSPWVTDINAS